MRITSRLYSLPDEEFPPPACLHALHGSTPHACLPRCGAGSDVLAEAGFDQRAVPHALQLRQRALCQALRAPAQNKLALHPLLCPGRQWLTPHQPRDKSTLPHHSPNPRSLHFPFTTPKSQVKTSKDKETRRHSRPPPRASKYRPCTALSWRERLRAPRRLA